MGIKNSDGVLEEGLGGKNEMVGILANEELNVHFFLQPDFDLVNFQ